MVLSPFRIKLVRGLWPTPPPGAGAGGGFPWPSAVYAAVFRDYARGYWSRATFGLVDLEFDLTPGAFIRLCELDPALAGDRRAALTAIRACLRDQDISLAGYNGFIAMVHSPPSDAGALGTDLLLDQGGSLEFFEHEIGHMLGFDHVFPVYNDRYCLMGETWSWDHAVTPPPAAAGIPFLHPKMWRSGRRVSAASLFRRYGRLSFPDNPPFGAPYVVDAPLGSTVLLGALAETTRPGPVVAIVPIVFGLGGMLTIEYRTASGDDAGLGGDAVVLHSIGFRQPPPGTAEVKPVWFEASLPVRLGAHVSTPAGRITVGRTNPPALLGVPGADGSARVYVTIERDA